MTNFDVANLAGVSCPSVETLGLHGRYSVEIQEDMLKMCPNLLSYQVSSSVEVQLHDLPLSLESLVIEGCVSFQVINLNENIKKIKFSDISTDSDDDIANIFTFCPRVQELTLSRYNSLTAATMVRIADTYSHTLTSLDLCGWGSLVSVGLVMILECCPMLRSLNISSNMVTNELLSGVAAAPLEVLNLMYVSGITEKGLMSLIDGCATLKQIYIRHELLTPLVKYT